MTKRVYNRESAVQVLQRTEWMTAGWISTAQMLVRSTVQRRKDITKFSPDINMHLATAEKHLIKAQELMRLETVVRKKQ